MERVVKKFNSFAEADEADRRFFRSLSGKQRLEILLEIIRSQHSDHEQGFKRVYRIVKLPRR
jgi:hypothetical protein